MSTLQRVDTSGAGTRHASDDFSGPSSDVAVRYEAVYGRADPAQGERHLLLAVLEEGIRTFLKNAQAIRGRSATLRKEALTWLLSEARSDPFEFESICEALNIDAPRLRRRVLQAATDPGSRERLARL
jgi:hypothetical protein